MYRRSRNLNLEIRREHKIDGLKPSILCSRNAAPTGVGIPVSNSYCAILFRVIDHLLKFVDGDDYRTGGFLQITEYLVERRFRRADVAQCRLKLGLPAGANVMPPCRDLTLFQKLSMAFLPKGFRPSTMPRFKENTRSRNDPVA